jgi:quercetin dioxygenase-like cupin family protein
MSNFHTLAEVARSMTSQATGPDVTGAVRRLARGEFAGAGLVQYRKPDRLHRQPNHEELIVVVEGEADFRVGDEVRRVRPGDFVFVPRDALHGAVAAVVEPFTFLSIFAPQFDLARDVMWEGDEAPRFRPA